MPARNAPSTDFTGRKSAQLAQEAKEEHARRAEEISMVHTAEQEINETQIFDVTGEPSAPVILEGEEVIDLLAEAEALSAPAPASSAENLGFVQAPVAFIDEPVVVVSAEEAGVLVRVAEDLEEVTIGAKTYNFAAGRKYKVEPNVEFVLRTAGKLYDRL